MSYKPVSLFRILEEIGRNELLLPHIQRAFVWEDEQMVRLFDSLMRGYPIQTMLFWRTREAIKARRFMQTIDRDTELSSLYDSSKSVSGVEKVFVLDGQQRIQTLYAVLAGSVLQADGNLADAYFDTTAGRVEIDGGDLMHRLKFSHATLPLPYYRIRNLREADYAKDAAQIADDINEQLDVLLNDQGDDRKMRERQVRGNFSKLSSLLREERHFWVEELNGVSDPSAYGYRKILDIFVRVNSGGTKLDASDLMFAAMKEGWDDIEENIEETVEMLNDGRLGFDKEFPLKAMLVALGEGAETSPDKFSGAKGEQMLHRLRDAWGHSELTFQQLRDFIRQDLQISSNRLVFSYRAFIPLFDFLYHNPKPKPEDRILMRGFFYKSQLFGWYSSSTDAVLNALHAIVGLDQTGFPLEAVKGYFRSRYQSVELSDIHFDDKRLRGIVLSIVYLEEWGASPFDVRFKGNEPHVDHIYPQYLLRSRLNQTTGQINDLGNLRFLGATDNIRKRAELPASYFGRLKAAGVPIEKHLLAPEFSSEPATLSFDADTYMRFRSSRRLHIARSARKIVDPEMTLQNASSVNH